MSVIHISQGIRKAQALLTTLHTFLERARYNLLSWASARVRKELTEVVTAAIDARCHAEVRLFEAQDRYAADLVNIEKWRNAERARVTAKLSTLNELIKESI